MYSAKGFTDYGKIFGAGLKEAARNIAIFSRQEEQEAEQKRKEREGKLERLYGAGPRINEGTIPPEMRGEVVTYLRDQRNMYDQLANQLVDYSASDPEYKDIINQMNNIKDNFVNMSNQVNLFTKRANDYTSKKDNWSGINNETDRNIVSEVYNRDFKNFAIVDNQLVVETEQGGVKTMNDIHDLYENLVPRAAKQMTDGLSLIRNANTNGLRGASFSPDQIRLQLGTILSNENEIIQRQNKQSLALDRNFSDELGMSFKDWVTNNNKLNQETMDIDGDGKLDNGWIKNDENEEALTGLLVDYYVDLAEKSHQSGKEIYDRDNPNKEDDVEENVLYKNTELDDLRGFSKVFDKAPVTPFTGPFSPTQFPKVPYQKRDRILNEEKTRSNFIKNVLSGWNSYKFGRGQEYITRDRALDLWREENEGKPDSDFDLIYNPDIEVFYYNTAEDQPIIRPVPVSWDSNKSIIGWQVKTGLTKATKDVKEFLSRPESLQGILDTDNTN
jgi:hypothetical protein